MKKLIIPLFCLYTVTAIGVTTPLTTCPSGYNSVSEDLYFTLYSGTSCPSTMVPVDVAVSCMVTLESGCLMYAPAGMSFVENGHTYEFDEPCPLTN